MSATHNPTVSDVLNAEARDKLINEVARIFSKPVPFERQPQGVQMSLLGKAAFAYDAFAAALPPPSAEGRMRTALEAATPILETELASFQNDTPPSLWSGRVRLEDLCCDDSRRQECANIMAALALVRAALASEPPAPIPMILHCPKCGLQHIDAPDEDATLDRIMVLGVNDKMPWTNPPHRSHLCHGCGFIWRPADVPTEGIASIATRGKADHEPPAPDPELELAVERLTAAMHPRETMHVPNVTYADLRTILKALKETARANVTDSD